MARYIDVDALIESLQEELGYYPLLYTREQNEWFDKGLKRAMRIVKTFPTADADEIKDAKAEVAREIFAEIGKIIQDRKNEEVKRQCDNKMISPFTYSFGVLEIIQYQIAELKKKYAEQKND